MMNIFQKKDTTTNQYHSITFRVDSEDKAKLSKQAGALKISLSEHVRNKVLDLFKNDDTQSLIDENTRLKNQIEEYESKTEENSSEVEQDSLTLKISEENKELLKSVLSFTHWNRFTEHPKSYESEFELAKAFVYCMIEYISETVHELRGLRTTHNLYSIEDLYEKFAGVYLEE